MHLLAPIKAWQFFSKILPVSSFRSTYLLPSLLIVNLDFFVLKNSSNWGFKLMQKFSTASLNPYLVMFLMVHNLVISSIWTRLLSLKSISAFGTPWASSNVFLTIFEVILRARCSFWLNYPSAACPHCSRLPHSESELSHAQRSAVVRFFKLTIADGAST